ncbi:MAG: T9SS type A sorting domain-containing protein, partial [Candidatus Cloacimonetes bacterium]|nr:T9SS type A sorting domain-containing protein [Candidatus Cloacimonadota bacterium]
APSIPALKIEVQDNYAFISGAFNDPNLYILNIEDILNPVVVAYDDSDYYRHFTVDGNYIYALRYDFFVVDISQITSPTLINTIDLIGSSIAIQDDKAYITSSELTIVDISNPYELNILGNCDIPTSAKDIVVDDEYAYITGSGNIGLAVVDINDSLNPILVQEIDYEGIFISKQNNNVYISRIIDNYQTYNGIGIIDVEDLNNINVVGEFKTCKANKLCINNNYAYVANGFSGLKIINISNPQHPFSVSDFKTNNKATDVLVDTQIAYVTVNDSCLQLIDVSNPSQPFILGDVSFPYYFLDQTALNLDKYSNYIYIGGNFVWDMYIIDVSDPTNPFISNQQAVNDFCYDVAIFENYLFLAGYWGGLQIFDLINPVYPVEVGYYPLDLALSVEAGNEIAFIGDPYTSLRIFDTSNISNPILTATYSIGSVKDMHCFNDTLYVASSTGIHLFDVTNPYYTSISGCYPQGVVYKNNYLFCTENFEFKVYGDTTLVSVEDFQIADLHKAENLSNYPNPFNPTTTISFSLNTENTEDTEIIIYNIKGQKVKTLLNEHLSKGNHSINWNGKDNNNKAVASGLYFYKLSSGKETQVKKMLLFK